MSEIIARQLNPLALPVKAGLGNISVVNVVMGAIARFGRHPHRNEVLGQQSTPEELEYFAVRSARTYPSDAAPPVAISLQYLRKLPPSPPKTRVSGFSEPTRAITTKIYMLKLG